MKYNFPSTHQESLPPFIRKLEEKRQTKAQQERASNSINLYYQIVKTKATSNNTKVLKSEDHKKYAYLEGDESPDYRLSAPAPIIKTPSTQYSSRFSKVRKVSSVAEPAVNRSDHALDSLSLKDKKMKGASWGKEYSKLENEIRVRQYSPRTLRTYKGWVRHMMLKNT